MLRKNKYIILEIKKPWSSLQGLNNTLVLASTAFRCAQEAVVTCWVSDGVCSRDACDGEPLLGTHTTHTHVGTIHLHYLFSD